jgi:hypothetical protein
MVFFGAMRRLLQICLAFCFLGFLPAQGATTLSVNRITVKGLEVRGLECRLDSKAEVAATTIVAALAREKKHLDACDLEGGAYAVVLSWSKGKRRVAKVRRASNRKAKRCILKLLRNVNPAVQGRCSATILVGASKGAREAAQSLEKAK